MQFHWLMFGITIAVFLIPLLLSLRETTTLQKRKEQSKNLLRENVLKQRIEKIAEEKVRYSKRYATETLCLQAGLPMSYAEYLMISGASAIVVAIFVGMIMNNPILAIIFLVVGYMVPKQVITLLKNRRVGLMEKQIGSFMQMAIKRYESTRDFGKALELSTVEFKGEEPLYTELRKTVLDINLGKPVTEAMDGLARRTGNKYMGRLSDYYKIASAIGTDEIRKKLLMQAYQQFEENRVAKQTMKKELSTVVREAYIMLGSIPMFAAYQIMTNDKYIDFMTNTFMGKVGSVVIICVFMGAVWFVNNKISAPLDE
ncbi:type II secretion system F family protein [Brevibacillus sp. NPDC058079]|uniref:type II secretion system F family protein n=1 Tax=Brevibacillus sp. NPDC058079 TaxID=3346330 RepID=UPI0036EF5B6C